MKRIFLLLLPLAFILAFSSIRKKQFVPPGTVRLSDTLFIDKEEISNLSWQEYLYWLKTMYGSNSAEYQAALPDSTVWLYDGMTSNLPWQSLFFQMNHFKSFPVSGLSYEQALDFCKWRTERVRYFMNFSKRYVDCDFYYRLPSKSEWEFAANGSPEVFNRLSPPIVIKANPSTTVINVSWPANLKYVEGGSWDHPIAVRSYMANLLGIFDMTGNVAEMLNEKGLCKGGSFYHHPEEARNGKTLTYQKAAAWLGFRCVCVVHPKK